MATATFAELQATFREFWPTVRRIPTRPRRRPEHDARVARDRARACRLMCAYWEEARNIGDSGEVLALAVEAGLDEKEAAEVITGDA